MKTLALIPTLTGKDRTLRLCDQLCGQVSEVVVVDNGRLFDKAPRGVEVISPGYNLGVPASWNVGLGRMATDLNLGAVLFVNDDVVLRDDTLEGYLEPRLADGTIGVFPDDHPYALFLLNAEALFRIGYFEEAFWPAYSEDRDYDYRISLCERRLGVSMRHIIPRNFEHEQSTTSRDLFGEGWLHQRDRWVLENWDRYAFKWGGPPMSETLTEPRNPALWKQPLDLTPRKQLAQRASMARLSERLAARKAKRGR